MIHKPGEPYNIDWSSYDHEHVPEYTCFCGCGAMFKSHIKHLTSIGRNITRKPCPICGRYDDVEMVRVEEDDRIIEQVFLKGMIATDSLSLSCYACGKSLTKNDIVYYMMVFDEEGSSIRIADDIYCESCGKLRESI